MDVSKRCSDCGETKPLDDFNRDAQRRDGHQIVCRDCRQAYLSDWRNGRSRISDRNDPEAMRVRFFSKVDKGDGAGCWIWTGVKDGTGYGRFYIDGHYRPAHRVSYFLEYGIDIPGDLDGCHHCDVPLCVRPDHIFAGTHAENVADMVAKGRGASGERSGARRHPEKRPRGENHGRHTLTEEQAIEILLLHEQGYTNKECAALYGVTPSNVSYLVNGHSWKHLDRSPPPAAA